MVIPNNKQWKVENCRVHVIEQLHGMSQNLIEIMEKKKPASTQILQDFENNLKAFCNNAKENGWGILKTKKGFECHWQDLKLKPSYLYMTDTQSTWHGRTQWDPICAKAILLCTCFGKDGKIGHAFAIICRKDWHCFFTTACLWICCSGDCLLVLFLWLCPRRFLKSSWAAEEVMKIINRSTVNRLLINLKILIQQKKGKS